MIFTTETQRHRECGQDDVVMREMTLRLFKKLCVSVPLW